MNFHHLKFRNRDTNWSISDGVRSTFYKYHYWTNTGIVLILKIQTVSGTPGFLDQSKFLTSIKSSEQTTIHVSNQIRYWNFIEISTIKIIFVAWGRVIEKHEVSHWDSFDYFPSKHLMTIQTTKCLFIHTKYFAYVKKKLERNQEGCCLCNFIWHTLCVTCIDVVCLKYPTHTNRMYQKMLFLPTNTSDKPQPFCIAWRSVCVPMNAAQ